MPADQPDDSVLVENGLRKAIGGWTWPGIEFGEPPSCAYTFFEYIDTLRFGDIPKFLAIEKASEGWWFPTLDRGLGASLHFAVDHGQLEVVKFLVEKRGVEVNQRACHNGWTPLHRAARVAHYPSGPHLEVFEYLLQNGADPEITSFPDAHNPNTGGIGPALTYVDAAAEKGRGWEPGEVRAKLQELCAKYAGVPKKPAFQYEGPTVGPEAWRIIKIWEKLPKLYPPDDWRPPPPAGFVAAQGWRRHAQDPWRPAGDNDGSQWVRQMTPAELDAYDKRVAEEAKRSMEEGQAKEAAVERQRAALRAKFEAHEARVAAGRAAAATAQVH